VNSAAAFDIVVEAKAALSAAALERIAEALTREICEP
jgi:hypothetical protein